ncbi:MAG: hypothetical protein HC881_11180, partial [Leptolyngbyaceae cyanobacterium SL_7_1]|nr:hypothetical protein [Leptolyngbyaceae cyanobacterium SL_7_1]
PRRDPAARCRVSPLFIGGTATQSRSEGTPRCSRGRPWLPHPNHQRHVLPALSSVSGQSLTTAPQDAEGRARWDAIAEEWLTLTETLSTEARRRLGRYGDADAATRKQAANQLYVGSRALNDLTDAQFYQLFPQQEGEFINQPIGQIWQAIAPTSLPICRRGVALSRYDLHRVPLVSKPKAPSPPEKAWSTLPPCGRDN